MNAPIKVNYENMVSFEELLNDDFIAETRDRKNLIYNNKQSSDSASSNIQINCSNLSKELVRLKEELAKSTTHFDKMAQASDRSASNLFQASKALRKAAERITISSEKRKLAVANS